MVNLKAEAVKNIQDTIDKACRNTAEDIPGCTIVVVATNGEELVAYSGGKRGSQSHELMSLDNIYWIASCTKMIVGIACMQLVEAGTLAMDDPIQLANLCPELKNLKVLQKDGRLVEKKTDITLRMLLNHTGEQTR